MSSQQLTRLAHRFGVRVKRMIPIKSGVYHLITPSGNHYCIKRMRYTPSRLRWIDKVMGQLRNSGYSAIAWRNPRERTGRLLFTRLKQRGSPFILTPWIVGKQPSSVSKTDLRACAKALAAFHLAGRKVTPPAAGAYKLLGKWPSLLRNREAFLKQHISKARRNRHTRSLNRLLQTYGTEMLSRSKRAINALNGSGYKAVCRKAASNGTLCHGDSGPKNFVITPRRTYMIDFETLRIDLRAYDLFRMIRLSCKNKGWSFDIARTILDGYQTVSKLERSDYELLKVWLMFPHKIVKLLSRYNRSTTAGKRKIAKTLRSVVVDERKLVPFLDKLDSYAKKER